MLFLCLALFIPLAAACQPPAGPTALPTLSPPASNPTPNLRSTPSPAPARQTPSLAAPPTSSPTLPAPSPTVPAATPSPEGDFTLLTAADFAAENDLLHDLILFTSAASQPFPGQALDLPPASGPQLWAVSPDGQRLGRLTDLGFAAYFPSRSSDKPLFIEYGVTLANPRLRTLALPEECYGNLRDNELALGDPLPCSDFQFSEDGRYLGMLFGPLACSRGILVMDTLTGKTIYRSDVGVGRWFEFVGKGNLLLAIGNCESGGLARFIPRARNLSFIGTGWFGEPDFLWNSAHNGLAVRLASLSGLGGAIWGYNAELDWDFFPEPSLWTQFDNQALWTPDGRYLLYHHRPFATDETSYTFNTPRKILRVDRLDGTKTLLAGSRVYDYHLCADPAAACEVLGDWVSVWRTDFQWQSLPLTVSLESDPAATCLLFGRGCQPPAERFAMNWRTGEKIPWAQFTPPAPTPTATPPASGPDLSRAPVYTLPSGDAFYIGSDGQSLWWVPQNGEPLLWVQQGQDYLYFP